MRKRLISVIVPVYNVESYLNRCIDSILNQSYRNLEILLIDDGSTDNSINIINKYLSLDSRLILIQQKNSGKKEAVLKTGIITLTNGPSITSPLM